VLLGWQVDACNTRHDAVLQLSDGRLRTTRRANPAGWIKKVN